MEFGRLIRTLREKQGFAQADVDRRGGPSRQIIGELENGHDLAPSEATLRKLDESLDLPSGFLRSVLICSGPHTSEYFDRARARGVPPEYLALHCDSGEEMEWPGTLLVGGFDGLQDRLLDAGKSLLIDVNAFPQGDAESGAGYHFIRRWSERFAAADDVRSTTPRAGIFNRGVVDALPTIDTLQQARKLLETVQCHAKSRQACRVPLIVSDSASSTFPATSTLPHTTLILSNVTETPSGLDRLANILTGEIQRRESILNAVGYPDGRAGSELDAALAALFVAYVAFSTEVSAFDVLDRIALRGPGLFPTTDVQLARWVQQEEQTESGDGSTADDAALDGRIALLWSKFRSAVGLTSDYGPRPDIEALYGYLGEALRQRREIVDVVLPSGGEGAPTRSEVTVWSLRDVVRTMPGILLYDSQRFKSLPALWQWSWEENNPGAYYWHVTSDAAVRACAHRGARAVYVGADMDGLIGRRFTDLAPGEAVLSHRRSFERGWLAVLTLAKSHGLESHPVFLPEGGNG